MESGFRNPRNFCLWNTEFGKIFPVEWGILDQEPWALESGIQLKESGIKVSLKKTWSSTWNPESTAWNQESKTVLDSLTWGDFTYKNFWLGIRPDALYGMTQISYQTKAKKIILRTNRAPTLFKYLNNGLTKETISVKRNFKN